jgi:hypothetical protein
MRRILKIVFTGIVVSILTGCPAEHYLIRDFEFYGAEQTDPTEIQDGNKMFRTVNDTLRNKLFFIILAITEDKHVCINNLSLIEKCHATSLGQEIDNDIVFDLIELRLDSDIYFETDTIEKHTDLWNHPKLKNYRWHSEPSKTDIRYRTVIGFADSLYEKIYIPPAEYTIELMCPTSDNRKMTNSIKLFIK